MFEQHDTESRRHAILACLRHYGDDDLHLIPALQLLLAEHGPDAYQHLMQILTNLDFGPDEARASWDRIIDHWEGLCGILQRQISLRTAICDYFCSINKVMRNPKLIEIQLFEQIDTLSKYDKLTNLFNRHSFDDVMNRELARANRHKTPLSLLLIDLDDFKRVNDVHGHLAGDKVLQHIARIILQEKRTEDIAARLGGDELAIILPETEKNSALVVAKRIRRSVEETPLMHDGQAIGLTLSGGVASFPQDVANAKDLLRKTDSALYQAKDSGKNTISVYSDNRRRYKRHAFEKLLDMEVPGPEPLLTMPVLGKNLSAGGLLLASKTALDLGVKIQISVPVNPVEPLVVTGKVVHIAPHGPDSYAIGIAFPHASRLAAEEIAVFMRQ
jgi:diguanylate cyclase (GGDEF)-like protein